jgi:hypothetical protein
MTHDARLVRTRHARVTGMARRAAERGDEARAATLLAIAAELDAEARRIESLLGPGRGRSRRT